jgi:GT2 family glycosyltransferase
MTILGGFVITYNRSDIFLDTIEKIFGQSFPPQFIWIIDNSEDYLTQERITKLENPKIKYYRMGFNAGPAGAAKKGLELCYSDGADWIYWGDDNDPPFKQDCFERLLKIKDENPFCGVLGSVGQYFDRKKGVIKRVQSRLLHKKKYIEVDYVAGNMSLLVSKEVVSQGVLPNPDLFFGFEELDFCLKVKRRGFEIIVDCGLFLEAREQHGKLNFVRPLYHKKANLVREYYSLRNLLYIADSLTIKSLKNRLMVKWFLKSLYGFRYGPIYGIKNFKYIFYAYVHYFKGIKGKTFDLNHGI